MNISFNYQKIDKHYIRYAEFTYSLKSLLKIFSCTNKNDEDWDLIFFITPSKDVLWI